MFKVTKLFVVVVVGFAGSAQVSSQEAQRLWCEYPAAEGPGAGKHVVLISGDEEYRSEEALPMLGKLLARRLGFKCTVLFAINPEDGTIDPNNQNNIPGMAALQNADLVILSLRFRNLPDEDMKFFDEYLRSGKPIIGLRTSTHAFQYPRDSNSPFAKYGTGSRDWRGGFGKQVLGETWVSHHGRHKVQSTRGVLNPDCAKEAILKGVADIWGPTDVYGVRELPEGSMVLVHGQVLTGMEPSDPPVEGDQNDPMMPLAWIRNYQGESENACRVFCTTMGASQDFESPGLRRLVVNAVFWGLQMEDQISAEFNVDYVDAYEPTSYGFNAFTPGLKPADYNLKSGK